MRDSKRTQGYVTVTDMGARRLRGGTRSVFISSDSSRPPLYFEFTAGTSPGDWTADGDLYYVDCEHLLLTRNFLVQAYNTNTSQDVLLEKINRDIDGTQTKARIWHGAPISLTVVIL